LFVAVTIAGGLFVRNGYGPSTVLSPRTCGFLVPAPTPKIAVGGFALETCQLGTCGC